MPSDSSTPPPNERTPSYTATGAGAMIATGSATVTSSTMASVDGVNEALEILRNNIQMRTQAKAQAQTRTQTNASLDGKSDTNNTASSSNSSGISAPSSTGVQMRHSGQPGYPMEELEEGELIEDWQVNPSNELEEGEIVLSSDTAASVNVNLQPPISTHNDPVPDKSTKTTPIAPALNRKQKKTLVQQIEPKKPKPSIPMVEDILMNEFPADEDPDDDSDVEIIDDDAPTAPEGKPTNPESNTGPASANLLSLENDAWDDSLLVHLWNEHVEHYKHLHYGRTSQNLRIVNSSDNSPKVKSEAETHMNTNNEISDSNSADHGISRPKPHPKKRKTTDSSTEVRSSQVVPDATLTSAASPPLNGPIMIPPNGLDGDAALANLLVAWYNAGYYTGRYHASLPS